MFRGKGPVDKFTILFIYFCFTDSDSMAPTERLLFFIYMPVCFFKQYAFCVSHHYVGHFYLFVSNIQPNLGELGHYYIFSHICKSQWPYLVTPIILTHLSSSVPGL